jgi:NADH dehydrogenase
LNHFSCGVEFLQQIIVLGAGYGGLMTALQLEEKVRHLQDVNIILVDRNDFHQYLHLSYEIVTGVKKAADVTIPLSELLEKRKIQFHQGIVERIDLAHKTVHTNNGDLPYSELVIALGSEPNFFNIKGAEHAFCVCSTESALRIEDELKKLHAQDQNVKVVIGGGGFTGVELAGEIADEQKCCVTIVEGTGMLLPTWGIPEFSSKVAMVLEDMGAKIVFNKSIVEIKPNAVVLNDGSQMDCSMFIWTAGVQASRVVAEGGLKTGKGNRAVINEYCEAVGFPGVYVVGDCALVVDSKTGEPLPQCIEIALQQADAVSKNLLADLTGGKRTEYIPKFNGLILAVGERYGIGRIAGVRVEGKLALMVKKVVHLHYVYKIAGLTEALEESL